MRRVSQVLIGLAALATVYLLIAGFLLFRAAEGLLTVGTIGAMLAGGAAPADPRALGYRGDPAAAFGMAFADVTLPGETGPLPAWVVPPEPQGDLGVIYVHGIAGAREDGYRHLPLLAEAGVPVLLITYRNDDGTPAGLTGGYAFGLEEWRDVEAAADWWAARGASRLIVVGESMGGGIVGQWLARSAHTEKVVGVALDSPALSFRRVLAGIAAARGLPMPDTVARVALVWQALLGRTDMRGAEVEAVLAAYPGPLFIAHGSGDAIVPLAIARDLVAARAGETIFVETDAPHLGSWQAATEDYEAGCARFLTAATRP